MPVRRLPVRPDLERLRRIFPRCCYRFHGRRIVYVATAVIPLRFTAMSSRFTSRDSACCTARLDNPLPSVRSLSGSCTSIIPAARVRRQSSR